MSIVIEIRIKCNERLRNNQVYVEWTKNEQSKTKHEWDGKGQCPGVDA